MLLYYSCKIQNMERYRLQKVLTHRTDPLPQTLALSRASWDTGRALAPASLFMSVSIG